MRRSLATALSRQQRWWLWLCVVSVIGFQALGLVHRALHGGPLPEPVRLAVLAAQQVSDLDASASASADADADADDGTVLKFGHVAGSGDCQLLDQLSHALGPVAQAQAWTALLPDHPVSAPQPHDATLAQVWRKAARGPPRA